MSSVNTSPSTIFTAGTAADGPERAVEVTLITGDRVRYEAGPGGRAQVTVVETVSSTAFDGKETPDGGVYLYPDVAQPYVASGVLDRELFNIKYLATHGYGDRQMKRLPLIVDYARTGSKVAARAENDADELAASRTGRVLESIGATGLSVSKARADRFWESLAPRSATAKGMRAQTNGTLAAGELSRAVDKIWLDRKVEVTLDQSVPLIGAPQAWEAGFDGSGVRVAVLDTGIDETHPDLEGVVVASKSFVSDTPADGHGHGTHVASTIAGSGAAADGQYKGVAPGADLVVGKVLSHEGFGTMEQVIDGMEWAAQEQDADVISMSLGASGAWDGSDPQSQAVNQLTESTGSLFVIAAGNDGSDPKTVGSPGVADAALTVAASNEGNAFAPIADFSSRGPRTDGGLKPDIAAPGVNIIAARAAGTDMCGSGCPTPGDGPINEHYYSVSGTSMATPHVAGAAAILAQQHPDWTAEQLKTTLMSTSVGLDLFGTPISAYAQGAGRVDVARAVTQQLRTDTANISPGVLEPDEPSNVTPITYYNDSTSDLTVSVDAALWKNNVSAAEGIISLDQDALTVPAGGSATLTVTIDPSIVTEFGVYDGVITASTEAGDSLRTPIGVAFQPPLNELTVRLVKPAPVSELFSFFTGFSWEALRVDDREQPWTDSVDRFAWRATDDPQVIEATFDVPDGIYSVFGGPRWQLEDKQSNTAWIIEPEVNVDGDTVITIDMRDLVPIRASADRPTEELWRVHAHRRTSEAGENTNEFTLHSAPKFSQRWAYPTEPVTIGDLWVREGFILAQPELQFDLRSGGRRVRMHPHYVSHESHKFAPDSKTVLATEADIEAGRDVNGALVQLNFPDQYYREKCPTVPWTTLYCAIVNRVQEAAEAGAAGVLLTTPSTWLAGGNTFELNYLRSQLSVPVAWLDPTQADQLAGLLESGKPVDVRIDTAVDASYEYKAWFRESGQVPADMAYELDSRDLKRVDTAYHGPTPAPEPCVKDGATCDNAGEIMHVFWPGDTLSVSYPRVFDAPTRRVEYYLPTGPEVVHDLAHVWQDPHAIGRDTWRWGDNWRTLVGTEPETIDWGTVATPGQARLDDITMTPFAWSICAVCRQGDHLSVLPVPTMGDGSHHFQPSYYYDRSVRLFDANGTELPGVEPWLFTLPPESGRYRLEHIQTDTAPEFRYGKRVSTVWDFTATAKPTVNEVEPPYGKPVSNDPAPAAWQPVIFLNYDIPLALDNTVRAGRPIFFTVHAAAGEPGSGADIAGLELEASFDEGESWADATVRPLGNGKFRVLIKHPRLSQTTGAVTLRTHAWDDAGNEVTQTIDRAYGLRR